ncbi:non-canonical purine NTP pyrophosphatase [bacterium]|nr:non-canonical purine NTP pyrophosphatase [bacterium]
MKIQRIVLITGNAGKMEEFKELIGLDQLQFGYQSLNLPEIQSLDVREIGQFKTREALTKIEELGVFDAVLTDDTSLCADALNGLPGPLIKWFLDRLGAKGLIKLIDDKENGASVTCLLSLGITKNREIIQFEGTVRGKLVSPKGSYGFGWDPVFMPDGSELTYGEMGAAEKNKISHRAVALRKLRDWLVSQLGS